MSMHSLRMMRTLGLTLALLGWLAFIGGIVLAILTFWQPPTWSINLPVWFESQAITAAIFFVGGILKAIILLGLSEVVVWAIGLHNSLVKIEDVFHKQK